MAGSHGQILACRHQDGVLFRVVGRATAYVCPELRHFAEACFAEGACRVRVDLRECTHFDSTFLGTLLYLKRHSRDDEAGFALIAPSPQCQQLLRRMVVAELFPVASDEDAGPAQVDGEWLVFDGELAPHCVFEFKRNVVDAHQELAQVGGSVGERFRPLAEAISQEFEAEQANRARD